MLLLLLLLLLLLFLLLRLMLRLMCLLLISVVVLLFLLLFGSLMRTVTLRSLLSNDSKYVSTEDFSSVAIFGPEHCWLMGKFRCRTRGVDVPWKPLHQALTKHVLLADCTPKSLFACKPKQRWDAIWKHRSLLSDILDISSGRVPRQVSLHQSFRSWLKSADMEWSNADSERASYDLKNMCSTLLARKRSSAGAPKRFRELQVLMDKMHESESDDSDYHDQDATMADADSDEGPAQQPAPSLVVEIPSSADTVATDLAPTMQSFDHMASMAELDQLLHDLYPPAGAAIKSLTAAIACLPPPARAPIWSHIACSNCA